MAERTNKPVVNNLQAVPASFFPTGQEPFFHPQGRQIGDHIVQAKLTINQPGDSYEKEADQVADKIVNMPESLPAAVPAITPIAAGASADSGEELQRKEEEQAEEEQTASASSKTHDISRIQRQENNHGEIHAAKGFEQRLGATKSSGSPLPSAAREQMEQGLGSDLSRVRIHTGDEAASLSQAIDAQAFTHGNDIYFNEGRFAPTTASGKRLLAHELAHVMQQSGGVAPKRIQRSIIEGRQEGQGNACELISTAYTEDGLFRDVQQQLSRLDHHNYKHVFVFTQLGLTVYSLSGKRLRSYPQRKGAPMFPYGLAHLDAGNGYARILSVNGKATAIRGWQAPIKDFPAEQQEMIRARKNRILLEDFVAILDGEVGGLLPAAIISGPLPPDIIETTVSGSWAGDLVAAAQDLLRKDKTAGKQRPDRTTHWADGNGGHYVNVFVDKESGTAALSQEDKAEDVKDKITRKTMELRKKQTAKAMQTEKDLTHGNLPVSDSTFLGYNRTEGLRPNRPAWRADITGPAVMVRNSEGTYKMRLHYEDDIYNSELGRAADAFPGVDHTWQMINITGLYKKMMQQKELHISLQKKQLREGITPTTGVETTAEKRIRNIGQKNAVDQYQVIGRTAHSKRDWERTRKDYLEDERQAKADLFHPLSAGDGSSADIIRTELTNFFSLATLPVHRIMSLGGWLVRSLEVLPAIGSDFDRTIPFPDEDGFYMVRCVAQPRTGGTAEQPIVHLPSVATKVVEIRELERRSKEELAAQDAELQARILELLVSYRHASEPAKNGPIREELEFKVQQAAQSNRIFLEAEIKWLKEQLSRKSGNDKEYTDIAASIAILEQGTGKNSGLISEILKRHLKIKEREIEKNKNSDEITKRNLNNELTALQHQLRTAKAREAKVGAGGTSVIRPQAVFINEADGQTIPVLIEIGDLKTGSEGSKPEVLLSDITTPDGDMHPVQGNTRADAVLNAIKAYAGSFPYGRGQLTIRIPESAGLPFKEPVSIRCNPRNSKMAAERLDELLQLVGIIGIAVPGAGIAASIVSSGVAAGRLLNRFRSESFNWDQAALMDMLAILGSVTTGISHFAEARLLRGQRCFALVPKTAQVETILNELNTMSRAARLADKAVNKFTYLVGNMDTVQKYLDIQRDEISGKISGSDARRQKILLVAHAVNDAIMHFGPDIHKGYKEKSQENKRFDEDWTKRNDPDHFKSSLDIETAGSFGPKSGKKSREKSRDQLAKENQVDAFLNDPKKRIRIFESNHETLRELLEISGSWQELILHLESNPSPMNEIAIGQLEAYRSFVVYTLGYKFGLAFSDPKASAKSSSDVDLATSGKNAGRRLLQADAYMRKTFPRGNWTKMFRMNFYTETGRLTFYEKVHADLKKDDFAALQKKVTARGEELVFARMLQHAGADQESRNRTKDMMSYLTPEQQARAYELSEESPAKAKEVAERLHQIVDDKVHEFKSLKETDKARRAALAEEITMLQMDINFRTEEANIMPGANRQVVTKVAVRGYEAYQSALSQLEMMEHIIHLSEGNMDIAIRQYELHKYITRFIAAMNLAGIRSDAFMLDYSLRAFDIYNNNRSKLSSINDHDQSYLREAHNHFIAEAPLLLKRMRRLAERHPTSWNKEEQSLKSTDTHILDTTKKRTRLEDTPADLRPVTEADLASFNDWTKTATPEQLAAAAPKKKATVEQGIVLSATPATQTPGGRKVSYQCHNTDQLKTFYKKTLSVHPELMTEILLIQQRMAVAPLEERKAILINEIQPMELRLQQLEEELPQNDRETAHADRDKSLVAGQ